MEITMDIENETVTRAEVIKHLYTSIDAIEKVKYLNNAITLIDNIDLNDAHHIGSGYINDVLRSEMTDLLDKACHSLGEKISPALDYRTDGDLPF